MGNILKLSLILLCALLAMSSCQNSNSSSVIQRGGQGPIIKTCLELQKAKPVSDLIYLDLKSNSVEKSGWLNADKVSEEQKGYEEYRKWFDNNVVSVALDNTSPSGDWYRIDSYCFNETGNIAEIYSDLRTSYSEPAGIQVIRSWNYYTDGSVESSKTELFNLDTKKPIISKDASYQDNPPKLVKNYRELTQNLELPAEAQN
jgi:hypothetical protein